MNTTHPHVGPTEAEVRKHFGNKLSPDAKLMRPAYTSVWALEDGTLLWDWKNGFADDKPKAKKQIGKLTTIMYVTGPAGSGKTYLVNQIAENACEISVRSALGQFRESLLRRVSQKTNHKTIVFTAQVFQYSFAETLKDLAKELQLTYYNINLTRN